ncbi:MAG TPA: Hsp20/alpha crystallin family protein [Firmicutes bacterium]|nr:Hsp20/alpha crystallin family protein [Bacillota bacterium]
MTLITLGRCCPPDIQGFETHVRRDADDFVIQAALPGVEKEKIQVTMEERRLHIKAFRDDSFSRGRSLRSELPRGELEKNYSLPENIDAEAVTSSYDNGILTVRLPLKQQPGPRAVPID